MWEVAYENGDPVLGDDVDVELAADWPGEPGVLAKALSDCGGAKAGFIEMVDGSWQVHDLFDHAPAYVSSRKCKEDERRKAKSCEQCGSEYRSTEKHSRFCSDSCRVANHRRNGVLRSVTEGSVTETQGSVNVTDCNEPPAPAPAPKNTSCSGQVQNEGKSPDDDQREKRKPPVYVEGDMAVATWMLDRILEMQPDRKQRPKLPEWANDIRLLRERDGRTHDQIREMFGLANADEFWRTNILSPAKLRKQWDTLRLKLAPNATGQSNKQQNLFAGPTPNIEETRQRCGSAPDWRSM
jgi:hypothetical protein